MVAKTCWFFRHSPRQVRSVRAEIRTNGRTSSQAFRVCDCGANKKPGLARRPGLILHPLRTPRAGVPAAKRLLGAGSRRSSRGSGRSRFTCTTRRASRSLACRGSAAYRCFARATTATIPTTFTTTAAAMPTAATAIAGAAVTTAVATATATTVTTMTTMAGDGHFFTAQHGDADHREKDREAQN